jgi:hypothetical protein
MNRWQRILLCAWLLWEAVPVSSVYPTGWLLLAAYEIKAQCDAVSANHALLRCLPDMVRPQG